MQFLIILIDYSQNLYLFTCFFPFHYRGRKRFVSEGDGGRLKPESY